MAEHLVAAAYAHVFSILALWSVGLSIIAFLPYIRDTFRGLTKPDRASWLIWSFLSIIAVASLRYEGGAQSVWFVGIQSAMTLIIFVQSIWLGAGSYLSRKNLAVFGAASVGLVLWYLLETSVYTLAIVITISALGAITTLRKAARNPQSETMSTWVISGLAALCGVVSVGSIDLVQLVYPAYLMMLYVGIVWAMCAGLRAQRRMQSGPEGAIGMPCRPVFTSVRRATLRAAQCRSGDDFLIEVKGPQSVLN